VKDIAYIFLVPFARVRSPARAFSTFYRLIRNHKKPIVAQEQNNLYIKVFESSGSGSGSGSCTTAVITASMNVVAKKRAVTWSCAGRTVVNMSLRGCKNTDINQVVSELFP
jgi:hypothetical protein